MRVLGVAALLAVLLPLAGCAASPSSTLTPTTEPAACPAGDPSSPECVVFVAVAADDAGSSATWLSRSPIRLRVESSGDVRTAIVDAPVNTYSTPTLPTGAVSWSGHDSAATAVGCAAACDADGFVGSLMQAPARSVTDPRTGVITLTAGTRTVHFSPTRAPVHPGSCDSASIDPLSCTRFVSVVAIDGDVRIPSLTTAPTTVTLSGSAERHLASIRAADGTTWSLHVVEKGAALVSEGAHSVGPGPDPFLSAFFAGRVVWTPHFSSVLLTSGDRTLQLEGAD